MCVTNTATRRPAVVSLAPNVVNDASILSQRLLGPLFPQLDGVVNAPATTSTETPKAFNDTTSYGIEIPTNVGACFNGNVGVSSFEQQKPKRRRKPQKPGKTAKMNDRHFVVHNYHDHATDHDENDTAVDAGERRRGGVAIAFPLKLHAVLDQVETDGLAHIVSWQPHGRCFVVHKPKEFVDHVMPKYFRQTKLTSFQRQLNLYGFCRLTRGPDASGYYHELFLRGKTFLCKQMIRTKVKGTKFKAASSPDQEPDFYKMPPVVVSPPNANHDFREDGAVMQSEKTETAPPRSAAPYLPYDPIPVPVNMQQQYQTLDQLQYGSVGSSLGFMQDVQESAIAKRSYADRILDEAVDELFSSDGNEGGLSDLRAWDLSTSFADDAEIEDAQLGMLLEKLLEE